MLNVRSDFPILKRKIHGKPLVYLDSAATSQKPLNVINAISDYYRNSNANIHRGIHALSEEATELHEAARKKIAEFIGAKKEEIIFVRNATEGINLVAYSWGMKNIGRGDTIISTEMEHHSNIVPWQFVAKERKARLKWLPITKEGQLILDIAKAKITTVTHVSNVLGTKNPVKEIGKIAHENGSLFLVDGAQSVPHMPVDVKEIDADFLVFSGHKMLGPTGIGVLYAKKEILEEMDPFMGGGDMIKDVTLEKSSWNEIPWKFEAGTPDIAGAIGLGTAVDYLQRLGMKNVERHEDKITSYALEKLANEKNVEIYGPKRRGGVISFNIKDVHAHDVASILDSKGIAIRSGHHCAQPLLTRLGKSAAARASFYVYTSKEEIDFFVKSLEDVKIVFKVI